MGAVIVMSYCGCITLNAGSNLLAVKDSDQLPISDINYLGLIIDSDVYLFDNIFANKADILTYLNTVLKSSIPLEQNFLIIGDFIDYPNSENFNNIEIMAIYGTFQNIIIVGSGNPDAILNVGLDTITLPDGSVFTDSWLENCKIIDLKLNDQNSMPYTGGYIHDSDAGTISFFEDDGTTPKTISSAFIFVTKTQIPA